MREFFERPNWGHRFALVGAAWAIAFPLLSHAGSKGQAAAVVVATVLITFGAAWVVAGMGLPHGLRRVACYWVGAIPLVVLLGAIAIAWMAVLG